MEAAVAVETFVWLNQITRRQT